MNVILIISDTFRRDHLGVYGNDRIHTPYLDRFAKEAVVFDRAYCASFPTVPHRADIMTGRFTFTYFYWSPLPAEETVVAQVLSDAGITTQMIADTPHILRAGYNFQRGFKGFYWIRGQENDPYRTAPREVKLPCDPTKLRSPERTVKQYLRNVHHRRCEKDYFCAQTMSTAAEWLEENYASGPFFLYVDTFDPHEPWDPPKWYVDLYDPGYDGEEVIYPRYAPCDFLTEGEIKHIRALYAGEVSLVDRWVGHLLSKIDDLGLRDSTAVIFTTDHGFYHGEHGLMGKSLLGKGWSASAPLYEEVAHIPLIVRLPGVKGGLRCDTLVQPPDITASIYELAGVETPKTVQGKSLVPIIKKEVDELRPLAVSSPSIVQGLRVRRLSTITTKEWALIYGGSYIEPGEATTRAVDDFKRKEHDYYGPGAGPALYHLPSDPKQEKNVLEENIEVARSIHAQYVKFLEELGTPEEYLQNRRQLLAE